MILAPALLFRGLPAIRAMVLIPVTAWVFALAASAQPPAVDSSLEKTVTPVASRKLHVRATLAQLAADPVTDGVLSGQNVGHCNLEMESRFDEYIRQFGSKAQHTPAIVAVDYGWDAIPESFHRANQLLIEHARAGGLVTISMHPPNPWRNSDSHDTRIGDIRDLWTPGTLAWKRWHQDLDRVARGLAALRDAEVTVLWRPLHEMNGGWFWWCPEQDGKWITPAEYRALWREMFHYFTREKGLDNLLWVYSPSMQSSDELKSVCFYYPGDRYVDVIGLSAYVEGARDIDAMGSYAQLAALGKPMGLSECGPAQQQDGTFDCDKVMAMLGAHDRLRFFVFWHSWPGARMALADIPSATRLLANPRIVSREALGAQP